MCFKRIKADRKDTAVSQWFTIILSPEPFDSWNRTGNISNDWFSQRVPLLWLDIHLCPGLSRQLFRGGATTISRQARMEKRRGGKQPVGSEKRPWPPRLKLKSHARLKRAAKNSPSLLVSSLNRRVWLRKRGNNLRSTASLSSTFQQEDHGIRKREKERIRKRKRMKE